MIIFCVCMCMCDTLDNERLDEDDDDDDVPYKTFDDWLIKSFTCKHTRIHNHCQSPQHQSSPITMACWHQLPACKTIRITAINSWAFRNGLIFHCQGFHEFISLRWTNFNGTQSPVFWFSMKYQRIKFACRRDSLFALDLNLGIFIFFFSRFFSQINR